MLEPTANLRYINIHRLLPYGNNYQLVTILQQLWRDPVTLVEEWRDVPVDHDILEAE